MKHLTLAFCLSLFSLASAFGQFSIGLKGGIATHLDHPDDIFVQNEGAGNNYSVSVENQPVGFQFGGYVRVGVPFFIQPEVVFNSNRTDYRITQVNASDVVKREKYQYLDVPVLLGIGAGPARVYAGPVGHYFLHSTSELTDVDGYEARFKNLTWGWQAGLGIGFGRLGVEARYEGNFNKAGNHMTFFGDDYHFSNNPSRLLVGLTLKII